MTGRAISVSPVAQSNRPCHAVSGCGARRPRSGVVNRFPPGLPRAFRINVPAASMSNLPTQFTGYRSRQGQCLFNGKSTSAIPCVPRRHEETLGLIYPGSYLQQSVSDGWRSSLAPAERLMGKTRSGLMHGQSIDVPGKSGFTIEVAGLCDTSAPRHAIPPVR